MEKRLSALVPEVKKQGSKKDKKKTKKKKTLAGKLKKKTTGRALTLKLKHSLKRQEESRLLKSWLPWQAEGTLESSAGPVWRSLGDPESEVDCLWTVPSSAKLSCSGQQPL